jgi:hypothetical protein
VASTRFTPSLTTVRNVLAVPSEQQNLLTPGASAKIDGMASKSASSHSAPDRRNSEEFEVMEPDILDRIEVLYDPPSSFGTNGVVEYGIPTPNDKDRRFPIADNPPQSRFRPWHSRRSYVDLDTSRYENPLAARLVTEGLS